MPAGFVGDEYVVDRLDAGVVIQCTQWNDREFALGVEPRHGGAADIAEDLSELARLGNLLALQVVLALEETDTVHGREAVGRVSGRTRVTTARAMTIVRHLERLGDMELDGAA